MKNPHYSQIHALFQHVHRQQVRQAYDCVKKLKERDTLAEDLQIDPVRIGRALVRAQSDNSDVKVSVQEADTAFKQALAKFEQVRNVSSPILKAIKIARLMQELINYMCGPGEVPESDVIFNLTIYLVVQLGSLGARFIEECSYIDAFMHDDQIGMIQQYTFVQHFKTVLGFIIRGEQTCAI